MAVHPIAILPDTEREQRIRPGCTKGRRKANAGPGMPGAGLTGSTRVKALSERPALQPYWGKTRRTDDRGDGGNVGIIRSPVRAIALSDNRHEVEDESSLRERSSDPLGLESCTGYREVHSEA